MKRNKVCAVLLAVLCIISVTASALAAEARSSAQIAAYQMSVISGSGKLATEFVITGNGAMNKLGCQSIYVYRKTDSGWTYVTHVLEDDEGMSKPNSSYHSNTIYIDCTAGVEYKVVVTVFAENNAGRDTRTQRFFVTGKGTAVTGT